MSSVLEELKAMEDKLRGIRADPREGKGHAFGRSRLARLARGESDRAPSEIYEDNMESETS